MISAWYQTTLRSAAAALLCFTYATGFAQQSAPSRPQQPSPPMYVVSDLHLSVGRAGGSTWHPMEDFRWANALDGFLRRIAMDHPNGVQLVIAGDFLELWQHPTDACTKLRDTECGCAVDEMKRIVADVLAAHRGEFKSIGVFLANSNNRVLVIPGNHDAALTNDAIWSMLLEAVPQGRERFRRVNDGLLLSDDGRIAIEHGHQQHFDVNSFPDWPRGVVKECGTEHRFFRPWGENFVQTLYNDVELHFPLIDNMVPDSEGAALYQRYSEQQGTTWADLVRFIEFNLLQSSFYQQIQALDLTKPHARLTQKEAQQCRLCLREEVFLIGNPTAQAMLKRSGEDAKNLREALRERARRLDDNAAKLLCERAVLLNGGTLPLGRARRDDPACDIALATAVNRVLDPDGTQALRGRVSEIYDKSEGRLALYVFGHTHEARLRMSVDMPDGLQIGAYNTGAFQRLMDRKYFAGKRLPNEGEIDALARLTHDDLAACYSVVKIAYSGRQPKAEVKQWFMQETDGQGDFLQECDARCSAPPANCKKQKE